MTWELRDVDLETFKALDRSTRHLILRLLDSPTDRDWQELASHPAGKALASWLLTLPAYTAVPHNDEDDEDDDIPRVPYSKGGAPYTDIVPIPHDQDDDDSAGGACLN
jgi:hypothetical protein